jgi:integrase/recombinase XerD
MSLRRFVPDTQREYIRAVKRLAPFLGRSPDTATPDELRAFQLHLTETGVQPPTINATVTALRFFFKVTLDRRRRDMSYSSTSRASCHAYSRPKRCCGCRRPPRAQAQGGAQRCLWRWSARHGVVALKVCDIDSKRVMLRVDQVKAARIAMPGTALKTRGKSS